MWYNNFMLKKIEKLLKALKTQVSLPSIKDLGAPLKTPEVKSTTKLPGVQQGSKKNPIKSAEQTQNKEIKDLKMKEAQEHFKINKSTGQWSLDS